MVNFGLSPSEADNCTPQDFWRFTAWKKQNAKKQTDDNAPMTRAEFEELAARFPDTPGPS